MAKKAKAKKAPAKAKKVTRAKPAAKKAKTAKRKPNSAFMAPMTPSAALAEVIGHKAIPRTEVIKRLWDYIKKEKLQDPENRRNIRADAALVKVFKGKKVVSMFEMTKLVNDNLSAVA